MSLNYTTLQSTVLAIAHRADLTAEVVDFIRQCEGKIRRDLRALEVSTTLTDTDRVSDGLYNLPAELQEIRVLRNSNDVPMENVGLTNIRQLSSTSDPLNYAVKGLQVEVRGVPPTGDTLELDYIGWPVALATTATNTLLDLHERIYIDGTLAYLYEWTQDLELSDRAMARCDEAIERLNQQTARKLGGTSVAGAYNLGNFSTSTGY